MSQRIAVDCDVHGARDETEPGRQYDIALRTSGEPFVFVTVDLCDVCNKPLLDLFDQLREVGREFDGEVPGVKTRAKTGKPRGPKPIPEDPLVEKSAGKNSVAPRATDTVENRTCPDCGFVSTSRKAATTHLRVQHGKSAGGEFVCPDCGDGFATPQGRGAHRSHAHPKPR